MIQIKIELDPEKLKEVESLLSGIKNGARKALYRATNRALTGISTDAAREISKELNLTQKRIKEDFKIDRASLSNLTGKFTSKGSPIPLIAYGAKQTRTGVTVLIKKSKGRKLIKGAFITRVPPKGKKLTDIGEGKGHLGVFTRDEWNVGTGKPIGTKAAGIPYKYPVIWPKQYRFPIQEMFGPRVEDIIENQPVMEKIMNNANERLLKELDHQVVYLLSQREAGDS